MAARPEKATPSIAAILSHDLPTMSSDPMGSCAMTHDEWLASAVDRLGELKPRAQAAVFWLLGSGLLTGLTTNPTPMTAWLSEARDRGLRFATTGIPDPGDRLTWDKMVALAAQMGEFSQQLSSAMICLSTPLKLSNGLTGEHVAPWVEHALFPVMQAASLRMFGDVAFPEDDESLDEVFAQPQVQDAVKYCNRILDAMTDEPEPSTDRMRELLAGAEALSVARSRKLHLDC